MGCPRCPVCPLEHLWGQALNFELQPRANKKPVQFTIQGLTPLMRAIIMLLARIMDRFMETLDLKDLYLTLKSTIQKLESDPRTNELICFSEKDIEDQENYEKYLENKELEELLEELFSIIGKLKSHSR